MKMKTGLLKVWWKESGTPQTNCVSSGEHKCVCAQAHLQLGCCSSISKELIQADPQHAAPKVFGLSGSGVPMSVCPWQGQVTHRQGQCGLSY